MVANDRGHILSIVFIKDNELKYNLCHKILQKPYNVLRVHHFNSNFKVYSAAANLTRNFYPIVNLNEQIPYYIVLRVSPTVITNEW